MFLGGFRYGYKFTHFDSDIPITVGREIVGRVQNKVAIITGAASGIGAAIARRLAEEGARIVITDVDQHAGEAMATKLAVPFFRQDVSQESDWQSVMRQVGERLGPLDILVNNAGIGNQDGNTNPEHTTLAEWQQMLRINGEGVFLGCRFGIEAMKAHGGAIVNLSSIASLVPTPPIAAYGFAKAGVEQFSRSVALYCAQAGYRIRCNSVHPGQIITPMLEGMFEKMANATGGTPDDARAGMVSRIPVGEFGTPEDIANGILYLVSDEARHVTGTRLVIDGGMDLIN